MLHEETIKPGTLDLINQLMKDQQLNEFYLVGGTALALQIGHRESIDVDLFSVSAFDTGKLAEHLQRNYDARISAQGNNSLKGNIQGVDIDLVTHNYPFVKPIEPIQGIRMVSLEDIAAMKMNAIVNSGQRIKDFIDVHYLLKDMTCEQLLDHYCSKYPNVDANMGRSSLLYHKDIDFKVRVVLTDKSIRWKDMEKSLIKSVRQYDKLLESRQLFEKMQQVKQDRGKNQGLKP